MKRLSSPTRVTPLSWIVPRLTVQLSRKTLRSPISSRVGSPAYFLSCGASPREANGWILLPAPIVVGPLMTTWGPTTVPGPMRTCRTDHAEGTHGDIRRQLRLRRHDGMGIDHFAVSGATMISAWATSLSPISAAVEKRQMPFR